eukprot:CAMPEP_0197455334 /NCGR_PEP_ID=MMETSP1175-20131217/40525_1 /TAXON_ID=1003142 /ORGANISM="Triceratium dubium, Strain CCMP147" /LENGTH=37 /DNA_ID= /DNA_START= /DNA_END= /DNA_ORIENTATION=
MTTLFTSDRNSESSAADETAATAPSSAAMPRTRPSRS